jgi:tetratricopeptide (TPR) repeat protein
MIYLYNNIGQIYYDKKNHNKAIQYWESAIQILEKQDQGEGLEQQAK